MRHIIFKIITPLFLWACFSLGSLGDDSLVLRLERSTDLKEWEPVAITPQMLNGEGEIIWPGGSGGGFFRLGIASGPADPNMVAVQGGRLALSIGTVTVESFRIGRFEVTWGEWKAVREQAAIRGYDIGNIGSGCADDHPVRMVNWFDVVKWCNLKSEIEGLTPVYTVSGQVYRVGTFVPFQNIAADGHRLPSEAEWEFAARGGTRTKGYTFSGSNTLRDVGWFGDNSAGSACSLLQNRGTWPVGEKAPNELGINDMSGNIVEWCWDGTDTVRIVRGGSWSSDAAACSVAFRHLATTVTRANATGFRTARNAAN